MRFPWRRLPQRRSVRHHVSVFLEPCELRVLPSAITGHVISDDGRGADVSIVSINGPGQTIVSDKTTWIVIHGRSETLDAADYIQALGETIAGVRPDDQVLLLDWRNGAISTDADSSASGFPQGEGEHFIVPVAQWAATALAQQGIVNGRINLVGHSWGATVAGEMAKRITGGVNTIIALDPARDIPTSFSGSTYNPEAVDSQGNPTALNFAARSQFSWAFLDSSATNQPLRYGSTITTPTADEAFTVIGTDHVGTSNVFLSILRNDVPEISARFSLDRLLAHQRYAGWAPDSFDEDGLQVRTSLGSSEPPGYDAVIQSVSNAPSTLEGDFRAVSLNYFAVPQQQVVTRPVSGASQSVPTPVELVPAVVAGSTLRITVANAVENYSTGSLAASTAVLYVSTDPSQGSIREAVRRPVDALLPGFRSRSVTELPLQSLPVGMLSGGRLYVALAVSPSGTPSAANLDWELVTFNATLPLPIGPSVSTITSLLGPTDIEEGGSFTFRVSGITDSAVNQVTIFRDTNGSGVRDAGDTSLGAATKSGNDWSRSITATGWATGDTLLFAETRTGGLIPRITVQSFPIVVEPPATRMFRAYNPNADYHFFTTSTIEFNNAVSHGYEDESTGREGFEVLPTQVDGTTTIYRLYNLQTGRHYYTISRAERDILVALVPPPEFGPDTRTSGWRYEKDEGFLYATPVPNTVEIFRLYNVNTGTHLYTENANMKNLILAAFPTIWLQHTSFGYAFFVGATSATAQVSSAQLSEDRADAAAAYSSLFVAGAEAPHDSPATNASITPAVAPLESSLQAGPAADSPPRDTPSGSLQPFAAEETPMPLQIEWEFNPMGNQL